MPASPSESWPITVHVAPMPVGHAPGSVYADRFWTPIIGPLCTLLWPRLLAVPGRGDLTEEGAMLGVLKLSVTKHAVRRLVHYQLASCNGDLTEITVADKAPRLAQGLLMKLPHRLIGEHARWVNAQLAADTIPTGGSYPAHPIR